MKFRDRVRGAWMMMRWAVKNAPYIMQTWPAGQPQWSQHSYLTYVREGYAKNTLVYACIREIASSAAEPRWVVYDGEKPAPDNGLQRVLDRPNKYFTSFELWELMLIYQSLDGSAFLLKERSDAGRVIGLWPMRPDLVAPVPSANGDLLGYTYRVGGTRTAWLPEDVIHLRHPNPADTLQGLGRGLPPMKVAGQEVDVDNSATSYVKQFFDNAAVPFGLLKSKNQLVETEIDRIRARLKSQYSGERNWHEIMILDADADYQALGLDMDKMAFPDLRAISESRICMVFGVPPIIVGAKVGLDRSTFANYAEARKSFWQETLSPVYRRIQDKLTLDLAPEFGGATLRVVCDFSQVAALQTDRGKLFERGNSAVVGGWGTVNDARREVGWEAVAGGDVFLRPLMTVATPARGTGQKLLTLKARDNASPALRRLATSAAELARKIADDGAAKFAQMIDRTARAWEGRFEERAGELFRADEQTLLERLARFKSAKQTIDWVSLNTNIEEVLSGRAENWREGFIPLFEGLVGDQGDVIAAAFGIDFSLENPAVQAFIRDYAFQFAAKVSDTSVEMIRTLTATAQSEGWTILEFMDQVEGRYDEWTVWRAEMIARSETIRSSNAGARASYQGAGVLKLQWWTVEDERRCPFCGEMHGKIISIEEQFWLEGQEMVVEVPDELAADLMLEYQEIRLGAWAWNGVAFRQGKGLVTLKFNYGDVGYPPLHPMCRCTILPVVD